jgi:hypothetical protein
MTVRLRSTFRLAAAVLLLGLALTSAASAQEAMQLDLMFKDSLLRGSTSREQGEAGRVQGRRENAERAREHPGTAKHRRKVYRHKR